MSSFVHQTRELAQLVDEPLQFFKQNFRLLAPVGLFTGVLMSIPSVLQQAWFGGMNQQDMMEQMLSPGGMVSFLVVTYGGVFLTLIAAGFMRFTQLAVVVDVLDGRPTSVFHGMRRALDWRLWVVAVLEGIIHSVAACFLCLPLLYTSIAFYPATMVCLHERRGPSTFGRCIQLFHHRAGKRGAWTNFVRIVVALHAVMFITLAATSLGSTVLVTYQMTDLFTSLSEGNFDPEAFQTQPPVWLSLPIGLFNGAVGGMAGMVTAALSAWVYRDLRDAAEGVDLRAALAARKAAIA